MKLLFRIFRSVLCYFSFTAIYAFVSFCVNYMFFSKLDSRTVNIIAFFALVFVLPSIIQAFAVYDTEERDAFLAQGQKSFHFWKEALSVIRSPIFICEALVFFALTALLPVLPINLGYSNITVALFYGQAFSPSKQKLIICAVMFPLIFLSELFVRITVRKDFLAMQLTAQKFHGTIKSTFLLLVRLAAIAVIYAIGFMVFPLYLGNAPAALMILGAVLPPIMAVSLVLWLLAYISAYRARKRFIKALTRLCRENGFELSEIRKPYSFVFWCNKGFNFTVCAHGKRYDCKFISGVHKKSPVMFDLFGAGVWIHYFRIRGKEIFKYVHRFEYAFESDNAKILIISPEPKEMYLGENYRRRNVSTGDTIGKYKIFNENGFLRSLELDVMDAKGKFE